MCVRLNMSKRQVKEVVGERQEQRRRRARIQSLLNEAGFVSHISLIGEANALESIQSENSTPSTVAVVENAGEIQEASVAPSVMLLTCDGNNETYGTFPGYLSKLIDTIPIIIVGIVFYYC
jgi:hypothetical protein